MISYPDVARLRRLHVADPVVLSLYLAVPRDPAELRGLGSRADELIAKARRASHYDATAAGVIRADRDAALGILDAHVQDWLGRMAAIFVCGEIALLEALSLPCTLPERAVLARRPHVRPLLAARQRRPDYLVAVADGRHASVLAVSGEHVRVVAWPQAGPHEGVALANGARPYQDAVTILERATVSERRPLVIGGHQAAATSLLQAVSPSVQDGFAGRFTADPRTLTSKRVRELGDEVIDRWVVRREEQLAAEISAAAGPLATVGLGACLTAVNAGAVSVLLIPDSTLIGGFECGRCGALSATGDDCPDWGTAALAVPDLLEEMAWLVLDDGGEVVTTRGAAAVTARLRFPVAEGASIGDQPGRRSVYLGPLVTGPAHARVAASS